MSALSPEVAQQIARALRGLAYGSIQLVIHEAQVVRIERVERIRLTESTGSLSDEQNGPPTPSREGGVDERDG